MARTKEFDRKTALKAAIRAFIEHGYEGTSTEGLLQAMGIGRQSMYDTFGDKRRLYLEALQHYSSESLATIIHSLDHGASPLQGLEAALLAFAVKPANDDAGGCLGVSAVCEFGRSDATITRLTEALQQTLHAALERVLVRARAAGEIGADVDIHAAALFLGATLSGLKVSARGGATPEVLSAIVAMALRSLR